MCQIDVEPQENHSFRVTVTAAGSSTTHVVTAAPDDVARLGGGVPATQLIEASFRFLLDREPPEAILERFDLTVIGRYFPEYPSRIGDYL